MADLYLSLTNKTQQFADTESAKVYPWVTAEIGNQGLPSKVFDAIAFIGHEIANNRLLKNSLTRQVRLRVSKTTSDVTLSIRYDGETFDDMTQAGPKAVQGIINYMNAVYGDGFSEAGDLTGTAGETLYTTAKIVFNLTRNE